MSEAKITITKQLQDAMFTANAAAVRIEGCMKMVDAACMVNKAVAQEELREEMKSLVDVYCDWRALQHAHLRTLIKLNNE